MTTQITLDTDKLYMLSTAELKLALKQIQREIKRRKGKPLVEVLK